MFTFHPAIYWLFQKSNPHLDLPDQLKLVASTIILTTATHGVHFNNQDGEFPNFESLHREK